MLNRYAIESGDAFGAMGLVFLLVLPLLFVMRRPKHRGGSVAMH